MYNYLIGWPILILFLSIYGRLFGTNLNEFLISRSKSREFVETAREWNLIKNEILTIIFLVLVCIMKPSLI